MLPFWRIIADRKGYSGAADYDLEGADFDEKHTSF